MNFKRILLVILTFCLILCGCSTKEGKIGIITESVEYGNEEFFATEKLAERYPDTVLPRVFPDNYISAAAVTNSVALSLAENPRVSAIIFSDAVTGVSAAIDLVKKERPDMKIICCNPEESISEIASKSDLVLIRDTKALEEKLVSKAKAMGAGAYVFYSYEKHLYYENILEQRASFKKACEAQGIEFIEVMTPDPADSLFEDFIKKNVHENVSEHGKNTAFFGTACAMQVPIIEAVLKEGALFPGQCCPSPYHSYPEALNIDLLAFEGASDKLYEEIFTKLSEHGQENRMSTWSVPVKALILEASASYVMNQKGESITDIINELSDGKAFCRQEGENIYYVSAE